MVPSPGLMGWPGICNGYIRIIYIMRQIVIYENQKMMPASME